MLRKLLPLILLATVVPLTAMAYASPPDPLWKGGYFDDGDNDDVIALITATGATVEQFPLDSIWHGAAPAAAVPPVADAVAPTSIPRSHSARAPPLS